MDFLWECVLVDEFVYMVLVVEYFGVMYGLVECVVLVLWLYGLFVYFCCKGCG